MLAFVPCFRACTMRGAWRLLLEEALARVSLRVVDVVTPNNCTCEGVATDRASCGVSISEDAFALLQVFRLIQPTSPSGYITLSPLGNRADGANNNNNNNSSSISISSNSEPALQKVCVPLDLRSHDVFVLEVACANGAGACLAIRALLDLGAQESAVYFVCLLASAPAIAEIISRFPAVHIVVGAVDPEVSADGDISPGFGSFSERYFGSTLVHSTRSGVNADV